MDGYDLLILVGLALLAWGFWRIGKVLRARWLWKRRPRGKHPMTGRPIRITDHLSYQEGGDPVAEGRHAEGVAAAQLAASLFAAEAQCVQLGVMDSLSRAAAGVRKPLPPPFSPRAPLAGGRDFLARPAPLPRRLYISGPMTGLPDWNYPAFHTAAAFWRARGVDCVSPAEIFAGRIDLDYATYIRRDIEVLLTCSGIALLPGWERSRGARIEREIAEVLGLDILEHRADGFLRVPQHEHGSGWEY